MGGWLDGDSDRTSSNQPVNRSLPRMRLAGLSRMTVSPIASVAAFVAKSCRLSHSGWLRFLDVRSGTDDAR